MSLSVTRRVRLPNEALGFPWKKAGALVIAEACEQEFRCQIHVGGIDTHGFRFVAIASTDSFAGNAPSSPGIVIDCAALPNSGSARRGEETDRARRVVHECTSHRDLEGRRVGSDVCRRQGVSEVKLGAKNAEGFIAFKAIFPAVSRYLIWSGGAWPVIRCTRNSCGAASSSCELCCQACAPVGSRSYFLSRAAAISRRIASRLGAPVIFLPLMKNVGVPSTLKSFCA